MRILSDRFRARGWIEPEVNASDVRARFRNATGTDLVGTKDARFVNNTSDSNMPARASISLTNMVVSSISARADSSFGDEKDSGANERSERVLGGKDLDSYVYKARSTLMSASGGGDEDEADSRDIKKEVLEVRSVDGYQVFLIYVNI